MKSYFTVLLLLCLNLCCSSQDSNKPRADDKLSSENKIPDEEIKPLVALGQLWGFLKYHHPAVASGRYDWDLELIKMVPVIRKTQNEAEWKKILANWIDTLPVISKKVKIETGNDEIMMRPDYGVLFDSTYFNLGTIEKLKKILSGSGIISNKYVVVNRGGNPQFKNEPAYQQMLYPDLSFRLLALYRYWGIINYFYPYRDIIGESWSDTLGEMIPYFVKAANEEQYLVACLRLITSINDSHAGFYEVPSLTFGSYKGTKKPPFEVRFIEDKLVVTEYTLDSAGIKNKIKIGDIILKINGKDVLELIKELYPLTPASNHNVKLRVISFDLLCTNSNTFSLSLLRNNKEIEVEVPTYHMRQLKFPEYVVAKPDRKTFEMVGKNIAYIFPMKYKNEEFEEMKKSISKSSGMIIDLRFYPSLDLTASLLGYLKPETTVFGRSSWGSTSKPGYFFIKDAKSPFMNRVCTDCYKNKVVVLVNEYTQSRGEWAVVDFQSTLNVMVIGDTTAGAAGKVSTFYLPGGIKTGITGTGAYYSDGTSVQRNGVKIDRIVKPTIKGIMEGRDELLEKAIEIINSK